jgi:hypothetical protein
MSSLQQGLREFAQFAAKLEGDRNHTSNTVFDTFPWPQFGNVAIQGWPSRETNL